MAQDTTIVLAKLYTATTTDRNMFNELTKTIANKSSQITTLTENLLEATEAVDNLKIEIVTIKHSNG